MKNISISLTDQHASEIEAQIASGDYASVSEVVRAALRQFLSPAPGTPDLAQIDRDIEAYLVARKAGVPLLSPSDVRASLKS